jgi:hypothetical protein
MLRKTLILAAAMALLAGPALASGLFTGLPASTSAGTQSVGAPTTGGGPITAGGCIPMDTGNTQGINPASQCVSPSQLESWGNGAAMMYSTAYIPNTVTLATLGNDTLGINGSIWLAQLDLPVSFLVTNVSCLNGSAVGTDNLVYGIYNATTGSLLASTALAGVLSANANVFQTVIPLTAPVTLAAGTYLIALQTNGTTAKFRTITANGITGRVETSQTGVFGTLPTLTGTSLTASAANKGPICFVN